MTKPYKPNLENRSLGIVFEMPVKNGGSFKIIECPFCGQTVKAYNWSLAGSGKRCPGCGAIHTHLWGSFKEIENGKA